MNKKMENLKEAIGIDNWLSLDVRIVKQENALMQS